MALKSSRKSSMWNDSGWDWCCCSSLGCKVRIFLKNEISDKEEFAARTIRNKITSKIDFFSTPVEAIELNVSSLNLKLEHKSFDISNIDDV